MSQLAISDGQPGNWEEPDFFLRRLEIARFQENGWQEPCESRGSCPDLWGRGGEIPLRYPTVPQVSYSFYNLMYLFHITDFGAFNNLCILYCKPSSDRVFYFLRL